MADNELTDEGATPRELVLEACRRNNTELLEQVIKDISKPLKKPAAAEAVAELLNSACDGIGNHTLHIAVTSGSYEVLDLMLDQEGVEVDPLDRLEKETPLHKAVRFVNGLPTEKWDAGKDVVDLLLDAGADPRVRNRAKQKPIALVDQTNTQLKDVLETAEYVLLMGNDIIREDDEAGGPGGGSASDSG